MIAMALKNGAMPIRGWKLIMKSITVEAHGWRPNCQATGAAVIQAFAEALTIREQERQASLSLELAERALFITIKRVKAGRVSPVEETRTRLAATTARSELRKAQGQRQSARQQLAALLRRTTFEFADIEGDLSALPVLPPLSALVAQVETSPRLILARQELARSQALAGLERARRIPNVTLSAGAQVVEDTDETIPLVGISRPLPLFDRNQGNWQRSIRLRRLVGGYLVYCSNY